MSSGVIAAIEIVVVHFSVQALVPYDSTNNRLDDTSDVSHS